jgi:hypothetical protein
LQANRSLAFRFQILAYDATSDVGKIPSLPRMPRDWDHVG